MKPTQQKLLSRRDRLLEKLAGLSLLVQGTYLERFTTCTRKQCACHRDKKHGPRTYVVVYEDKKQRQIYVPQAQISSIRLGLRQYEQLLAAVKEITRINLALMRMGVLAEQTLPQKKRRNNP